MNRIFLAGLIAVAFGSSAMAQSTPGVSTTGTTGNKVTLAKPPVGTAPPSTKRNRGDNNLNNTPLTPQIAKQPGPTIGSPIPIAGPGGTTTNPTGY
jgi:hypothetical protein